MRISKLSKRLETAASCIQEGERLVDIGSDHAYLPCELVEQGLVPFAIAGEVADGPLSRSLQEVKKRKLEDAIDVRKGNGLSVLRVEDQVTTASICGMGGELIHQILEDAKESKTFQFIEHLVLQPNVKEKNVRKWLDNNGFDIIDEKIVIENDKFYEIICARRNHHKAHPVYSEKEYIYGIWLCKRNPFLFIKKWEEQLLKKQRICNKIHSLSDSDSKKTIGLKREIIEIKERIAECQKSLETF